MAKKKVDFVKKIKAAESIEELKSVVEKVDIKDRDKAFVVAVRDKTNELINRNI